MPNISKWKCNCMCPAGSIVISFLWTRTILVQRINSDRHFWLQHRRIASEFSLSGYSWITRKVLHKANEQADCCICFFNSFIFSEESSWTIVQNLPPAEDTPPNQCPANITPVVRCSPTSQDAQWTVRPVMPTMGADTRSDQLSGVLKNQVLRCSSPITDAHKWVVQELSSPVIQVSIGTSSRMWHCNQSSAC